MHAMHARNSLERLNVLIVDDEEAACENLRNILSRYGENVIRVCAVAHDTQAALPEIEKHRPDALFLDIDMPGENAFHFLARIYPFAFEVVFVTAYDEYAVRAFKLNAVDYILKPVGMAEIDGAIERLRQKIAYKRLWRQQGQEYSELVSQMTGRSQAKKIFLKEQNNTVAVAFADIYLVEAMGSYSKIYFTRDQKEQQIVMSHSLAEYEELLPDTFFRVHKSYLVNCAHLKKVSREEGNFSVLIHNAYHVPVSRRRHTLLLKFIENL